MFFHDGTPWFAVVVGPPSPTGARRVVTGRRHRPTYLVPVRTSRLQIPCKSALERDYVRVVSVEPDVGAVRAQPHTLRLRSGSVEVRYTPDLAVERLVAGGDGRSVGFAEVKPAKFAERPEESPGEDGASRRYDEWRPGLVAAAYAHLRLDYRVVTEEEVYDGARLSNALLIARHACVPVPEAVALRVRLLLTTGAAATAGECLAGAAEDGAATAHLLALAYRGFLSMDLRRPFGPDSGLAWYHAPAPDAHGHIREATFALPPRGA